MSERGMVLLVGGTVEAAGLNGGGTEDAGLRAGVAGGGGPLGVRVITGGC